MGNNLEHQEKVHDELEQVFKDTQTPASVKELSQLKYLERVIKETLRLYPSVPIITRKLAENITIGKYQLNAIYLNFCFVQKWFYRQIWTNEPTSTFSLY